MSNRIIMPIEINQGVHNYFWEELVHKSTTIIHYLQATKIEDLSKLKAFADDKLTFTN